MILDKIKNFFFKDSEGDFDEGKEINEKTTKRNSTITSIVVSVLLLLGVAVYFSMRPSKPKKVVSNAPVEFGAIIEKDFTEKDNQSALSLQQITINQLEKSLNTAITQLDRLTKETEKQIEKAREDAKRLIEKEVQSENRRSEETLRARINELERRISSENKELSNESPSSEGSIFGERKLPPRPMPYSESNNNENINEMQYSGSQQVAFNNTAFDSHDFFWEEDETEKERKTVENYVPTGTFVTAVVTGGADTNAGVLGQGDTTPIVFQTVNQGILPNGEKSKLSDCTITASAYGEISSSRGIVRTNRLSCIQSNGDILDLPIKGTAFNFGRNGIRGTTILKNGKIVQMAGIAGILTGLGETGKSLSQTTSTSALGSTSSVNGGDALVNMLGNATSSVGSKLAEYYIKLAEMYHPIVEINPGAVVNIVFLEGFPLDPLKAEEYERRMAEAAMTPNSNGILDIINSVPDISNPLAKEVGNFSSAFGSRQ